MLKLSNESEGDYLHNKKKYKYRTKIG